MSTSFQNKKELRFVITLGSGSFGSSNNNQITLQGYRAIVDIDKAGGMMMGTLRAQIFGMSQSDMNSCITYPYQPQRVQAAATNTVVLNTVQVYAVDGDQQTLIFTGNIVTAWPVYTDMPNVFLLIQAMSTLTNQLQAVPPTSFKGSIDVATAMQQLAGKMNLQFENNGVSVQLQNQYLPNTYLEQAKTLAQAAGIWMYIDNNLLIITPKNQGRNKPIPLISPANGLKGYPAVDGWGVRFDMFFNPAVIFGAQFELQSDYLNASGIWIATNIAYKLESEKPDGAWFATIRGTKTGLFVGSQ